jgi:SAM-dependent MidA family methyltransferase
MSRVDGPFRSVPPSVMAEMERLADEADPYRLERQGKKSAQQLLKENTVTDPTLASAVMGASFSFRDFQSLALFDSNGYFPTKVDYRETMMLLPQLMSPVFGATIGEIAFAHYVQATQPYSPSPTFLGLGAGRGYLDRDLYEHITSDFIFPDSPSHARAFSDRSRFIVSDSGDYAISRLKKEIKPLTDVPKHAERIRVETIDALNFRLEKSPFGIVYCNELIDNLPTEPIVNINGILHMVRMQPYLKTGNDTEEQSGDIAIVASKMPSLASAITQEKARQLIKDGQTEALGFSPVFLPLNNDPELRSETSKTPGIERINDDDFNGIYPVHFGLDKLFKSVKESFNHGVFIIIDYTSFAEGTHNWNKAVNQYKHYSFGEEDIDFQIDPEQIIGIGEREGFICTQNDPLGKWLMQFQSLLQAKGNFAVHRWAEANGMKLDYETMMRMAASYMGGMHIANGWNLMVFHF